MKKDGQEEGREESVTLTKLSDAGQQGQPETPAGLHYSLSLFLFLSLTLLLSNTALSQFFRVPPIQPHAVVHVWLKRRLFLPSLTSTIFVLIIFL